ncbi:MULTISPECIES: LutC/YkgG family protein [Mycetohabitans]|nr:MULTISPECIES: lactate utilization protein C [Mycetohabitans]MCG1046521.1 lactate utilization protein C [Mycetohabitans sp. B6]
MDTSAARRNIIARIRAAQRRPALPAAAEREALTDYLARHPVGPRPDLPGDLVELFVTQSRKMATSVACVDGPQQVPAAVAAYLHEHKLATTAVAWPALADYGWADVGRQLEFRMPRDGDLTGITGCFCAVAETGTLALLSGEDEFVSAGLLPQTHIAIVPASRVVGGLEDAFALMRAERGELPRAVNFISGPSRTGDIEQTIVLGAHGPYRVHAVVVRDA